MNVVAVSDERGEITNPDLLAAAEAVHRQLRPHLRADYMARFRAGETLPGTPDLEQDKMTWLSYGKVQC